MESRAKQRLTGAIILVALFVLLVPELLTGPRDSHPETPGPGDEGMHRYTIELDSQRAQSAPTAPAPAPSVALPPVTTPMNPSPQLAAPGEAAAPEVSPAPPAEAATKPVVPVARPSNVPASTPAPTSIAKPGSFVVQLGTFGKRENADRLARDMTAKGFAAFVTPTTSNGHELYRVRVGPTRDRASAEALAVELRRAGQSGSIVPIS